MIRLRLVFWSVLADISVRSRNLPGPKPVRESAVVAQEIEFEMSDSAAGACRVREEIPELYFCADMQGYGWCFRKGNILNIGLGRADPHRLSAHVTDFQRFLKSSRRISFDVPPLHGHAYLLYGTSTRNIVGEGYVLVGDAAGLAAPQSGEGIRPAIESGLLAAQSIAAANGRYSQERLESYRTRPRAGANPAGLMDECLGRHLPLIHCSSWTFLLSSHWFVRKIVLKQWFLQPGIPRLNVASRRPNGSLLAISLNDQSQRKSS